MGSLTVRVSPCLSLHSPPSLCHNACHHCRVPDKEKTVAGGPSSWSFSIQDECSWFINTMVWDEFLLVYVCINFTTNLIGSLTIDHLGRFGGGVFSLEISGKINLSG